MDDTINSGPTSRTSRVSRYARLDTTPRSERQEPRAFEQYQPTVRPWQVDISRLVGWLRQGKLLLLGLTIAGAIAGFSFGAFTPPRFTATTDLLIDPAKLQVVADDIYEPNAARESQLLDVEGKLRVMTSGNVIARVVSALNLQNDPEFVSPRETSSSANAVPPELIAQRSLQERVRARREERSFVVTLSVTSQEPQKAVTISEALVKAFQAELIQADSDGAGRTAQSLMDRLTELRNSVNLAEEKVEAFKRENQLQSTGGQLMSASSLTLLNNQVLEAQHQVVQAESRYRELVDNGSAGINSDALQSPTMASLRAQYATAKQLYDAQSLVLGSRHPKLASLHIQVETIASEIAAETARLVDSARSDFDQATAALEELTTQSSMARSTLSNDNEAEVQLRELERDAASKATIYEAFLTRAGQVTERQQLDTTNIRVISPATVPETRTWPPRTAQTTIAGFSGGLIFGGLLAIAFGLFMDSRRRKAEPRP